MKRLIETGWSYLKCTHQNHTLRFMFIYRRQHVLDSCWSTKTRLLSLWVVPFAQLWTREQHCSSLQQSNMSNWKKYGSYLIIHALMYSSTMKSIVVKTIWNFNLLDPAIHFEIYASDIVWFFENSHYFTSTQVNNHTIIYTKKYYLKLLN